MRIASQLFRNRAVLVAMVAAAAPLAMGQEEARELSVLVGKSILVDSPVNIERVSVADPALAEAVAASPRELILNGRNPGETSLILWQQGGTRLVFDLKVTPKTAKLEVIRGEIAKELPGQNVTVEQDGETVFLRGTVPDETAANRALALASVLGKPVNLLNIKVPPVDPQILMKVRFADVDRGANADFGANIFSLGALNTIGSTSTQTFGGATFQSNTNRFLITDVLNIFLLRPDIDLASTIRALEAKRLLQILAEPNVLAINGKTASFLAGGEFPFPTLQGGGAGLGAVTVQFREFGVRINFTPRMTPRGTIRLEVTPEVSSLDYANSLTFQGFTIPGIATRRVTTEVELEDGQSFAIGGLLDNRFTETLSKIPGIGDLPILGKLFRSRTMNKSNAELVVIVTPEIVRPIPKDGPLPEINFPKEFLKDTRKDAPRTPGIEVTGPVPLSSHPEAIPYEDFVKSQQAAPATAPAQGPGLIQFVPVPVAPGTTGTAPAAVPQPAAAPAPRAPGPNGD
jgi:pilus assembly protein CpaC